MIDGYAAFPSTATIVGRVEEVAKKRGVSMAQVAIAWSMCRDGAYQYINKAAIESHDTIIV